ncbi:MAG: exported protein of unknown function, partial [Dehalococcoidia bacterium]|nr:exported protein of unknown function [Dehalococcoidia bacterium]
EGVIMPVRILPGITVLLLLSTMLAYCSPTKGMTANQGEPFDITVGQSVAVVGTTLRINLTEVENDSRCPVDVTCVRAGDATVKLSVVGAGPQTVPVVLVIGPEDTSKATAGLGNFVLTAIALAPPPVSTQPISQNEYVLRMIVRGV